MMRWLYIFDFFVVMLCAGSIYTYSIFRKPLEKIWQLSPIESGVPFQLFLFFFAFSMPLSGYLIEKKGVRFTYYLGTFLISLSWIFSYFSQNILQYSIIYGIMGCIGVGTVYSVPIYLAQLYVPDNKGLAIGLTVSGFGLSSFINSNIFAYLLNKHDILSSFLYFGIGLSVIMIFLGIGIKNPETSVKSDVEEDGIDCKEMFKTLEFRVLYLLFTIGCLIGLTVVSITSPFFMDNFVSDIKKSAFYLSFFAIFNALGRPLFGFISDKYGLKKSSIVSFSSIFLASLIILICENCIYSYFFGFSILWMNLGAWLAIAPVSTLKFFGRKHYSKNYGIVYTAYGIGAISGINLSGYLITFFNSYSPLFTFTASISILILPFLFLMWRKL